MVDSKFLWADRAGIRAPQRAKALDRILNPGLIRIKSRINLFD